MNSEVKSWSSSKKKIFETATDLFGSRGYAATTVRDIAKGVGLEVSSLYSHISSKEEILRDICFRNAQRFLEGIDDIMANNSDPIMAIRSVIGLHVDVAADEPTSILVFNDEWKHLSHEAKAEFVIMRKSYEKKVTTIIQQGIDNGCIIMRNPLTLMRTILAALKWVYFAKDNSDKESIKKTIQELLIGGLIVK